MTRKLLLAAALLAAAPALARAQSAPASGAHPPANPFGLRMGMTLRQLAPFHPHETGRPGVFTLDSVPSPDRQFKEYWIVLTPEQGLCKVRAVEFPVKTQDSGDELRAEVERVAAPFASTYGSGVLVDVLKEGSQWTDPQQWMMSLRTHDRTYARVWRARELPMPADLGTIGVEANAAGEGTGRVAVAYEFTSFSACRQEVPPDETQIRPVAPE